MSGLKDQLLKSGLVNQKQLKKAQLEKRKENRQIQGQGKSDPTDEERRRQQQAAAEKAERDRQLNRQRKEEAERKAVAAQVRQLIEANRQPKGESETPFHFEDGGKVKRLYLGEQARKQVTRGQLALVRLNGQYELVPAEVADKIAQRDDAAIVLRNAPPSRTPEDRGDDPYAGFEVPDDLTW